MLTESESHEIRELYQILANLADGRPLSLIPSHCVDPQLIDRYFALSGIIVHAFAKWNSSMNISGIV